MKQVFVSVFCHMDATARYDVPRAMQHIIASSFGAWKISCTHDDLTRYLGLVSNWRRFPLDTECVDDLTMAHTLAGHGLSRMVLQSYPPGHTRTSAGIGVVISRDNMTTLAIRTRSRIATKRLPYCGRKMQDMISHLEELINDPSVWDLYVDLHRCLRSVFGGHEDSVTWFIGHDGRVRPHHAAVKAGGGSRNLVILPGSFNPLHIGHVRLLQVASGLPAAPEANNLSLTPGGALELTVRNPEQGLLSLDALLNRVMQCAGRLDVFVSSAPLFCHKARIFPGSTFVLGVGTADRLFDPHYYDSEPDQSPEASMEFLASQNCRFLVAGRSVAATGWKPAEAMNVPSKWRHLFDCLPEDKFRIDISSTQLRKVSFTI